jgi:Zn finger protein HypA/HybF involved in hydrogenase expression
MIDLVPLKGAVLCEDCQQISHAVHSTCPGCGSRSIWLIANLLARLSVFELGLRPHVDDMLEAMWRKS